MSRSKSRSSSGKSRSRDGERSPAKVSRHKLFVTSLDGSVNAWRTNRQNNKI